MPILSRRRPQLTRSLADRIDTVGRLPVLGTITRRDEDGPEPPRTNSAQRVRLLHDAFTFDGSLAGLDGPVLLVDDLLDSGWTMTLAARLLRRSGAPAVLPLTLAVAG